MSKRPSPPSKEKKKPAKASAPVKSTSTKKEINEEKKERRRNLAHIPVVESVTQSALQTTTVTAANKFLELVVEYCGNISKACEASGVARYWVYLEEKRNEEFAERFREAQQMGLDALEDKARERAALGVEKDVYYQGEVVGVEINYSDTLMALLLKGGKPEKYKDRVEHTGNPNAPVSMEVGPTPLVMGFLEGLRESDKDEEPNAAK